MISTPIHEIPSNGEPEPKCQCGSSIKFIDGDYHHQPIPDTIGIGWEVTKCHCEKCGIVYGLALCTVSDPLDEFIGIDGFQIASASQYVTLRIGTFVVDGLEQFSVLHCNPMAEDALRGYDRMGTYYSRHYKDRRQLLSDFTKIAPDLVSRIKYMQNPVGHLPISEIGLSISKGEFALGETV